MNIIPPGGGESGGGGNALPVKEVIGGKKNSDNLVLTPNTDYYIYIPNMTFNIGPNNITLPYISLTNNGNFYLYDTFVDEANGSRSSALPINCILKIKSTQGKATLIAENGFIFVLDM